MKSIKTLRNFWIVAITLIAGLPLSVIAQQSSAIPNSAINREISAVNLLINDYQKLEDSFKTKLEQYNTTLTQLADEMNRTEPGSREFDAAALRYKESFALALSHQLSHYTKLDQLIGRVDDHIERLLNMDVESNQGRVIQESIQSLEKMGQNITSSIRNNSVLSVYAHDLSNASRNNLDYMIDVHNNNTLQNIESNLDYMYDVKNQVESNGEFSGNIHSQLTTVRNNLNLRRMNAQTLLISLNGVKGVLMEQIKIEMDFNEYDAMLVQIDEILTITDESGEAVNGFRSHQLPPLTIGIGSAGRQNRTNSTLNSRPASRGTDAAKILEYAAAEQGRAVIINQ